MRWLGFLLAASPVSADTLQCQFDALCEAGRSCHGTISLIEIQSTQPAIGATLLRDGLETPMVRLDGHTQSYASEDMLFSINDEGIATLSLHTAPVRTYLGHCTGTL